MIRTFCILGITALMGSALFAQADPKAPSDQDRMFLQDAAKANQDEIALGKLAQEKSSNPQIKSFGMKLVNDHTKNQMELENLASSQGVSAPPRVDATTRSEYQQLQGQSGTQFDHAFTKLMMDDHEKAISMYEQALKDTKDPAVRRYINVTLPALRLHLREARSLERSLGKG
jgi:putative membrane protein